MVFVKNELTILLLLLLCCGKQTWRTSRLKEEVQWGFVKVKEWSYCVAHRHTLEVIHTAYFEFIICMWIAASHKLCILQFHKRVTNCCVVWNHFSDSSSTACLSGLSGSHVCPLPLRSLFVCVVEVSGVSHFYFGTLWSVILIFNGDTKKNWHADWKGCLWLGPCQAE